MFSDAARRTRAGGACPECAAVPRHRRYAWLRLPAQDKADHETRITSSVVVAARTPPRPPADDREAQETTQKIKKINVDLGLLPNMGSVVVSRLLEAKRVELQLFTFVHEQLQLLAPFQDHLDILHHDALHIVQFCAPSLTGPLRSIIKFYLLLQSPSKVLVHGKGYRSRTSSQVANHLFPVVQNARAPSS